MGLPIELGREIMGRRARWYKSFEDIRVEGFVLYREEKLRLGALFWRHNERRESIGHAIRWSL